MNPTQAEAATETPAASSSDAGTPTSQPDMSDASLEQLDELMTTGKVTLAPKPGGGGQEAPKGEAAPSTTEVQVTPAGEEPPATQTPPTETPPVETPTTETPPVETETPETPPAEPAAPKGEEETASRFRFSEPKDRAIAALKKARPDLSWTQVEGLVAGGEPTPVSPETVIQAEPIVVQAKETITALDTEIAALETQIDEAGQGETLVTPEFSKAVRDLAAKREARVEARASLKDAEREAATQIKSRETEATRHKTARLTSRSSAIELYPDVADDQTALGKAVAAEFEAMKDPNHPDNPILFADSAPEIVTERVAKKLGIQPKAKAAAPPVTPATPTVAQPARKAVSPPSGGKTSVPVVPPAEDVQKKIEHLQSPEATLEELDAAFGAGDPTAVLAAAVR